MSVAEDRRTATSVDYGSVQGTSLTSLQPRPSVRCLLVVGRCVMVAAVAAIITSILFSARAVPENVTTSRKGERVDSPRPAPDALPSTGAATPDLRGTPHRERRIQPPVPSANHRLFSFNGHLSKPVSGDGKLRVRTSRPRVTAPDEPQPLSRGISIDVTSSRMSRPIEVGRNGTWAVPPAKP